MTISPLEPRIVARSVCLNCDAQLTGPFCANCGQRDVPPYPSVRDLVVDAFWELSGWDGRFASTVKALVQRPGFLTREFLEGRRARYISPLRLYLMASLVYFVLAAAAPSTIVTTTRMAAINDRTSIAVTRPERVVKAAASSVTTQQALTGEERDKVLKDADKAPSVLRPMLHKAIADPTGFKRSFLEAMPRMLFALLPVYALLVALFYRGRKYPEHLYFAIHVHSFIFLALGATALLRFTHLPIVTSLAGIVSIVWIPIYLTKAFRRVYGGSLAMAIVKTLVIEGLYAVTALAALLVTVYLVSIAG